MASRIKGITVEIGGDTSGLEKSLAAVNNSIKKHRRMWRKPLSGAILGKTSTWLSNVRWKKPGGH